MIMEKLLENSLAEAIIVIGMDENTGLTTCKSFQRCMSSNEAFDVPNDGSMGPFQLHVLGVLSGSVAAFPLAKTFVDGRPFYKKNSVICPTAEAEISRKERLRRSMSYASSSMESIPYSNEVIYSLATFCFPDGGTVSRIEREPYFQYLVLTNMEGDRSYACCLVIDRKFKVSDDLSARENVDIGLEVFSNDNHTDLNHEQCLASDFSVLFVPFGVCLASKYPYFNVMRHCLSAFLQPILNQQNSWQPILELSTQLFSLPVPPAGPIAIDFTINGKRCIIPSPNEAGRRPDDIELHLPLLLLSAEDIVRVVRSILTQQRMIFLSSSYSLLTLVIESFFVYVEPFKWRLTYVPVLPNKLADLIEAPGPFIMGCHSSLRRQVCQVRKMEEIPSIVLVDLDEGKVDLDTKDAIPVLPNMVDSALCLRLKWTKYLYDVEQIGKTKVFDLEEATERRKKFTDRFTADIKAAFLDAMVTLFGDSITMMHFSDKFFDREGYLKNRHELDYAFYECVCSTDAFVRFVDDRLENPEKRDAFAVLAEKFYRGRKSVLQRNRSSSNVSTLTKKSSFSITALLSVEKELFRIPTFRKECPISKVYFQDCLECLTKQIVGIGSRSSNIKASYYYLRGMMHMACDMPIKALEDFFSLYTLGEELFPKDYVADIMSSLTEADERRLREEEFYKRTANFRKYLKKSEEQRAKASSRKLPNVPIKQTEFESRVKTMQIATSDTGASWLYRVITQDSCDVVSPDQFELLHKTFFDYEKYLRSVVLSGVELDSEESVLAVSPLINTTHGMGRLVMTTILLYFMSEGSRQCSAVIRLHDVKEVVKFKHYVVFPPGVPALRIVNKDKSISPFFACLKEDRDLWVCLINEMATGHESAFSYKDPKILEIACNNVLLANVIVKMGNSTRLAEGICAHHRGRDREKDQLSDDTRESLERRLDPSDRESRRVTVMSVVYVAGRTHMESATLWCGLGSGAIIIYKTDDWEYATELRYARHRIGCLLLVDETHVWAGSYDSVIYVIDVDTRKVVEQLTKHSGFISDMICSLDDTDTVWSASYSGQLLQWNIETHELAQEPIQLSGVTTLNKLIFAADKLWCVTTDTVFVISPSNGGQVLEKITVSCEKATAACFESGCRLSDGKVWIAGGLKGQLHVIDTETYEREDVSIKSDVSFNVMVVAGDSVWIGCKDGEVLIIDPRNFSILRELNAHTDVIKSMCVTREGHVITGSSSGDGKLCVWNTDDRDRYESADSLGYEVVDGRRSRKTHGNNSDRYRDNGHS